MSLVSCHETVPTPYKNITRESLAPMFEPAFELNPHAIRRGIDSLMRVDGGAFATEKRVRTYYKNNQPLIWIDRNGVSSRADTALAHIRRGAVCGLDTTKMRLSEIDSDIQRLRRLDVAEAGNGINTLMARVEYNLTRAYTRYSAGQMFGFVNPDKLYNNLIKCDSDTISGRIKYSRLCDLRPMKADSLFYATAIRKALNDSVGEFLSGVSPRGKLYNALTERLSNMPAGSEERAKTLCNIERCRWRQRAFPTLSDCNKYVIVNVPSFSLRAVNGETVLPMRVAVGTKKSRTPLLTSSIMRMDLNPQWIIPKSIAKGIVGKTGYMRSEGMFVYDKKQGKLPPEAGSYAKIMDGEQYIIQAGGIKNPLGRIIFRFNNSFSVFLHDTSSPWLFQRNDRALSHGCVRVEKPLDLALFMLEGKNEELEKKIKYSMSMPFTNDSSATSKAQIDNKLVVNNVSITPNVPIYITYYTMFYGDDDRLVSFDDVYGYDSALAEELSPYNK